MQEFVRTIDTTEAFKFKIHSIEQEISKLNAQITKLKMEAMAADSHLSWLRTKAGFLKLVIILGILFEIYYALIMNSGINDMAVWYDATTELEDGIVILVVTLVIVILAILRRIKLKKEIIDEKIKVDQITANLNKEIDELKKSIEVKKQEIAENRNLLMNHMVNQQQLIESEVRTINTINDGLKECPRCAEMVKRKAKICRFCNYEFKDE